MGRAMNASGDPIEALDAAADAAAATGLDVWVAFSTSLRSSFRLTAGDLELGLRDAEEADAAADIGITRLSRAIALFLVGRYTEAYEVARAASSGGEGLFVSDTLDVMTALARVACGEVDAGARDLAVGAKKALAEAVSPQAVPTWLLGFAVRAAAEGDVARAGRILGSIDRPPGWRMSFITQALPIFTHYRTWVREAVGPDDARRLRDEGRAIPRRVMLEREVAASDA
jgi:hypothetical protein